MERKTKKMVELESQITSLGDQIGQANSLIKKLDGFKPVSKNANDARTQEINDLEALVGKHRDAIQATREQLELATISMLAGKDVDMADPTPGESLRNAS